MANNAGDGSGGDLLDTILAVVQGQREQNINELVSLLALSNLLGIISFLNQQDIQLGVKDSSAKSSSPDLKDMAMGLLGNMGAGQDKKINPALLMNLLKTLSAGEGAAFAPKPEAKPEEKRQE